MVDDSVAHFARRLRERKIDALADVYLAAKEDLKRKVRDLDSKTYHNSSFQKKKMIRAQCCSESLKRWIR